MICSDSCLLSHVVVSYFHPPEDHLADIRGWSKEQVHAWIKNELKLDAEDADKMLKQEIDGKALLTLTEEKLLKLLPLGSAAKLALAVSKLNLLVAHGLTKEEALQITDLVAVAEKLKENRPINLHVPPERVEFILSPSLNDIRLPPVPPGSFVPPSATLLEPAQKTSVKKGMTTIVARISAQANRTFGTDFAVRDHADNNPYTMLGRALRHITEVLLRQRYRFVLLLDEIDSLSGDLLLSVLR